MTYLYTGMKNRNKRFNSYREGVLSLFTIAGVLFIASCSSFGDDIDYRSEMRSFVISISEYSHSIDEAFCIIPQNGIELVTDTGSADGPPEAAYLAAIDANGQEDLFYGYNADDSPTPSDENLYLSELLEISKAAGNRILVTDYCYTQSNVIDSYASNASLGFISFAADRRELNSIPSYPSPINQENSGDISDISDADNFLYLINLEGFASKTEFINSVTATNYDLLIIDLFFNDGSRFSAAEIDQLRQKANGGRRLVVCYMSIGEAEDYRYYWKSGWNLFPPDWIEKENPDWEGNYKVRYWDKKWQDIIFGNDESYLKLILDAGFNGVYLDIIDAYEYFE